MTEIVEPFREPFANAVSGNEFWRPSGSIVSTTLSSVSPKQPIAVLFPLKISARRKSFARASGSSQRLSGKRTVWNSVRSNTSPFFTDAETGIT